jgi:hypothetical protein
MKNKPIDLHNHLFEQLERLNDEDLKGEAFELECRRAQHMCSVAGQIIANRQQLVNALKAADDLQVKDKSMLMLE